MKIIAHRGLSGLYPENTLLAFEKALECNVDGIETDLRLSLDEVPFVFHDANLKRLSGVDKRPEELRIHELKQLHLEQDQHIPTLDELLELVNAKALLILEIKYNPVTYMRLCEHVEKRIHSLLEWVEVSCFDDRVLEYLHQLNPDIRLHKLIDKAATLKQEDFEIRYDYTHYLDIDVKLRKQTLKDGLLQRHKVIFWTVDKEDISKEKEAGLYGIMSNDPQQFL